MKWLETPQDEAERLLREGLDQASVRTGDEITHRRVWAKVVEGLEGTGQRQPLVRARFVLGAAVVLLGAGVVGLLQRQGSLGPVAEGSTPHPAVHPQVPKAPPVAPQDEAAQLESERVPGHVVRTRAGEHARVALGGGARAELAENSAVTWDDQHRPSIQEGSAQLTVPHQPPGWRFSVTAGPYVVTVVGTRFDVRVVDGTVGVVVREGVVEVARGSRTIRLAAGDSWQGPLHPEETQSTRTGPAERPSVAPPSVRAAAATHRGLRAAEAALRAGDTNRAIELLTRTAAGTGPAAQNAAYELGRITRYTLGRPRQAVALWDKYRARFPSGLLRTEADLSILDTLSSLGDVRAALAEADAFLSRHPGSERRPEVQKLAERLRAVESAAGQR
jgi:hypothetical protein